jgi:hypothetical protein
MFSIVPHGLSYFYFLFDHPVMTLKAQENSASLSLGFKQLPWSFPTVTLLNLHQYP